MDDQNEIDDCSCMNCRRHGIPLEYVKHKVQLRQKFCHVKVSKENKYLLCMECRWYLVNRRKDEQSEWPSMIWSWFIDADIRVTIWIIIPQKWRLWWIDSLRAEYGFDGRNMDAMTEDVTAKRLQYKKCMVVSKEENRIANCSWKEFVMTFEDCEAIPMVRCPWGCSETIGKAGKLPFDWCMQNFVSKKIGLYCRTYTYANQRYAFRKDLFSENVRILGNPQWECKPSFTLEDGSPSMLCCRYHNSGHTQRYVHAPRNPTGSISLADDNAVAQIVAVPRVFQGFKSHKYSDSYGVRKITGNFSGIDSTNLTCDRKLGRYNSVSNRRDLVSIRGRENTLNNDDNCGFPFVSSAQRTEAEAAISQSQLQKLRRKYGKGGTYVPLEDAFLVQKDFQVLPVRNITCREMQNEVWVEKAAIFTPAWSSFFVRILHYEDVVGDVFPFAKCFSKRLEGVNAQRCAFVFLNSIHMIPALWKCVDGAVEKNYEWHGWVLQYLWLHVLHFPASVHRNSKHPFYCQGGKEFEEVLKYIDFSNDVIQDPKSMGMIFEKAYSNVPGVQVLWSSSKDISFQPHRVVIIVYDVEAEQQELQLDTQVQGYDLVFFSSADNNCDRIYCRHGFQYRFWEYARNSRNVSWKGLEDIDIEEVVRKNLALWRVCMFVQRESRETADLHETLLCMQGGQTKINCHAHNRPLVMLCGTRSNVKCSEPNCQYSQEIGCPCAECRIGICKIHWKELNKSPLSRLTVGRTVGVLAEHFKRAEGDEQTEIVNSNYNDEISICSVENYWEDNSDWEQEEDVESSDDELELEDSLEERELAVSLQDVAAEAEAMDDFFDVEMNDSEDESDIETSGIPGTESEPVFFNCDGFEGRSIPHHVLLNVHGNLLMRRHTKLKGTKASKYFLQRLACVSGNKNWPLLNPEASMYPNLFWTSTEDGSVVGGLPSCMLMDDKELNHMGLASLWDHARTRILDPSLLSSTSFAYHGFLWDLVANLGLRGTPTDVVLRRGFTDYVKKEGLRVTEEFGSFYDAEQIDSRKTVNQLAAAGARHKSELFFTWTMNASTAPGVKKIHEWIRSDLAFRSFEKELLSESLDDVMGRMGGIQNFEEERCRLGIEEAAGPYILRCWMEFSAYFLLYMQFGADSPFKGALAIKNLWDRWEIQNEKDGKAPHHHTIIYLCHPPRSLSEWNRIGRFIKGSIESFFSENEDVVLVESGILQSEFEVQELRAAAIERLTHHCTTRCRILKQTRDSQGVPHWNSERKCKAPDNRRLNPYPGHDAFVPLRTFHTQEALKVMVRLGMIHEYYHGNSQQLEFHPTTEFKELLEATKHCPAAHSVDSVFSPANPILFAMLGGPSMNLQIVTAYLLGRYLTKYCATVDKANRLSFDVKSSDPTVVSVAPNEGFNTKISSNAMAMEKKLDKQKKRGLVDGRCLSEAELLNQMLQYPMIRSTFDFIEIHTQPVGLRAGIKRQHTLISSRLGTAGVPADARTLHDIDTPVAFAGYRVRHLKRYPKGRQFDKYQMLCFADGLFHETYLDKVSVFGMRPPELRFVKRLAKYHIWFERKIVHQSWNKWDAVHQSQFLLERLDLGFPLCWWIDALGYRVRVRRLAVSPICKMLRSYKRCYIEDDFGTVVQYEQTKHLFEVLNNYCMGLPSRTRSGDNSQGAAARRFLCDDAFQTQLPIYYYRTVRASQTENFLYHLLLSMGSFNTEMELMSQGSLKKAFAHARLLPNTTSENELSDGIDLLVKRYAKSQLFHYPLGSASLDRELVTAHISIRAFFLEGRMISDSTPSVLYAQLKAEATEEVEGYVKEKRSRLIKSYCGHLAPLFGRFLPCDEDFAKASPSSIVPLDLLTLPKVAGVSKEAYEEHRRGYQRLQESIQHYQSGCKERTSSIVYVGAGGVGKTIDLRLAGLYGIGQGLNVAATTITGKRSTETAGEHIHIMFKAKPNDSMPLSRMVELAYIGLLRDPKRLVALQRIDILLLDEMGQLNVKLLSFVDQLMRRIRHSSHWMGGVLVVATMDILQLRPCSGLPSIFSPTFLAKVFFVELKVPLRTLHEGFRRIQEITRMTTMQLNQEGIREEFRVLCRTHFTFVRSFDDPGLPSVDVTTYCFPRRQACREIESKVLADIKRKEDYYLTRKSEDWEETRTGTPTLASISVRRKLDDLALESEELVLYVGAPFILTYNDNKKGKFFHGQLCLLTELPEEEVLETFQPIFLYRAPHGVDELPECSPTPEALELLGWEKIQVAVVPMTIKHNIGCNGSLAYRRQYGLRHRIAMTIHTIMGSTVAKLVTKVDNSREYRLWEKSQLTVLLSRTRLPSDIYFVGDTENVISAMWSTLTNGGKYEELTRHILDGILDRQGSDGPVYEIPRQMRILPMEAILPCPGVFAVYMLLSTRDCQTTYIGYTKDLNKRIRQHNSYRGGSLGTAGLYSDYGPWGVYAYVIGFERKISAMKYEGDWKMEQHRLQTEARGSALVDQICDIGRALFRDYTNLKMIHCGKLVSN